MSKVDVHAPFMGYSGALGKIVYRKYKGQLIACLKPSGKRTLSEAQAEHQARVKKATVYAKRTLANEATAEIYELVAKEKDIPAFALCVADFLKPPSIDEVETTAYNGHEGTSISIFTSD